MAVILVGWLERGTQFFN